MASGGGERMGMERQLNRRLARAVRRRGRPGRFDWLWRSLLALLGVALFHGVFACMVLEKARRAVVPEVSDEETLRLWCMSADDGRLSPVASDFLRLNDALLDDVGQVTLLDASLEHPVRQASPSGGLTLGWGDFTRRLDAGLSASPLSLGRHGELGELAQSGVAASRPVAVGVGCPGVGGSSAAARPVGCDGGGARGGAVQSVGGGEPL